MNITSTNSFVIIDGNSSLAKGTFNVIKTDNAVTIKTLNGHSQFIFSDGETQIDGVAKTNNEVYLFLIQNSGSSSLSIDLSPYAQVDLVNELLATKAPLTHVHSATDITSGIFAIARIPTGSTGTTVALGNHTHAISDITNLQTTLDGKALLAHTHNASDINAGVLDIARIPTGTTATTVALGNHTHTIANITNLQTTLDGKASTVHTHAIADVTSLQTELDAIKARLNALENPA